MRPEVEAVSEEAAGFLTVAETELVIVRFGQQGAHRFKCVETGFWQWTPAIDKTYRAQTEIKT